MARGARRRGRTFVREYSQEDLRGPAAAVDEVAVEYERVRLAGLAGEREEVHKVVILAVAIANTADERVVSDDSRTLMSWKRTHTSTVCPSGMGTSTSDSSSLKASYAPSRICHEMRFGMRLPSLKY